MTEQSGPPDPTRLRASDADRERVAQILQSATSAGRLDMSELSERLEQVYAARTLGELEPVLRDLPEGHQQPGAGSLAVPTERRAQPFAPAHQPHQSYRSGGPALVGGTPGSTASVAVMAGTSRKGNWVVPPQHTSVAFWGGVDIDLRTARFAQQHVTITAVAIMGGIEIVVPDDVIVDVSGFGFMGAFELTDHSEAPEPGPDAPVVKINGLAFWGAVEVIRKPRQAPPVGLGSRPSLEK